MNCIWNHCSVQLLCILQNKSSSMIRWCIIELSYTEKNKELQQMHKEITTWEPIGPKGGFMNSRWRCSNTRSRSSTLSPPNAVTLKYIADFRLFYKTIPNTRLFSKKTICTAVSLLIKSLTLLVCWSRSLWIWVCISLNSRFFSSIWAYKEPNSEVQSHPNTEEEAYCAKMIYRKNIFKPKGCTSLSCVLYAFTLMMTYLMALSHREWKWLYHNV